MEGLHNWHIGGRNIEHYIGVDVDAFVDENHSERMLDLFDTAGTLNMEKEDVVEMIDVASHGLAECTCVVVVSVDCGIVRLAVSAAC